MSDLFRAMSFKDDVSPVFEALSEWCKLRRVDPDSLEGCRAASTFFDLFQSGYDTKAALLKAMETKNAA